MNQIVHVPNELDALLEFVVQAIARQQFSHALEACESVLHLDVDNVDAHHYLSHVYKGLNQPDLSRMMMARALQLAPAHPQINYNAGVDAQACWDDNRAMLHYQQALRVAPNMADALWNYGELLRMGEHFSMAIECFERLVALGRTHYQGLWHRMVVCYSLLNRHAETRVMYDKIMSGEHDVLSRWERALYLLSQEDFSAGTILYNDRFLCDGRNSVYQHDFPYPLWDGIFKPNLTVLLHGEQGLGDELMFASMFNQVLEAAEHANAQVVIACRPGLVRLFAASFPRAQVCAHKIGEAPAKLTEFVIDAQMAMGHLMSIYRRRVDDFAPHRMPYLKPNVERTAYYAQRLQKMARPLVNAKRRFRVGLMWGSNPAAVSAKFVKWTSQRSIALPLFADFADLLDEVEFISLQNFERGAEAALVPQLNILDFSLDQTDFYDTAALVANLDLVISVDTSVSHLAGGMGVDTFVPLMTRPDWRHGRVRDTSLWYKGTRYFRQTQAGVWTDVIEQMHQALRIRVADWRKSR